MVACEAIVFKQAVRFLHIILFRKSLVNTVSRNKWICKDTYLFPIPRLKGDVFAYILILHWFLESKT